MSMQFRLAFKGQRQSHKSLEYCCLVFDIRISDLLTIQFRLSFKDKGHKSLEYYCLVIHLTSVISSLQFLTLNRKAIFLSLLRHEALQIQEQR